MDIDAFGHKLRQLEEKVAGLDAAGLDRKLGEAFDHALSAFVIKYEELAARVANLEQISAGLQERLDLLSQHDAPPSTPPEEPEEKDDSDENHEEGKSKKKKK